MVNRKINLSKTGVLGAFEELVLLALVHQGENAYAVSIRRELVERSGSESRDGRGVRDPLTGSKPRDWCAHATASG